MLEPQEHPLKGAETDLGDDHRNPAVDQQHQPALPGQPQPAQGAAGELRDLESISAALTIAETGHLTFGTLHTIDAVQSINRLIDVFPAHQQQQVRTQLSFTLEATICQQLVTRADGRGRALCAEVLLATPAVRSLIRDDKAHQLTSIIQTGGKIGMRTMNQSLNELYRLRKITYEEAVSRSTDVEELKRVFQRQS